MGFLDYYTENSQINEYSADGSALAGMVNDIDRKKAKDPKSPSTIGIPKNVWHMPKWDSGYNKAKQSLSTLLSAIEEIPATDEVTTDSNGDQISIRDRFKEKATKVLEFIPVFMEYRKLNPVDVVQQLPKIREDIKNFKDAVKAFNDEINADLATLAVEHHEPLMNLYNAFKSVVDTDYKTLLQFMKQHIKPNAPQNAPEEPEDDLTPEEKAEFARHQEELANGGEKQEPSQPDDGFVADNPEDLPKVSSKDTKGKIIKSRPASDTPSEPRILSADDIKALMTHAKDKKNAEKPKKTKPLAGVELSPEARRRLADKKIKRKLTDGYTYGFLEHYNFIDDDAQLQMNLNEESPYLINRIVGNVAGAMGQGLKGLGGLALAGLRSLKSNKVKTQNVNGDAITKYSGRGRFFNVPYSGYVASNAACAQSLTEFKTLYKEKGLVATKTITLTFVMVKGRVNLEINTTTNDAGDTVDEDILPIIKSLGYTPPNGVNSLIAIETTVWNTTNGGNIIAMSTLANPDEEDQATASAKANTAVVIDADERADMLFFVGADAKGEKFFVDNFSMSFRQYLQSVKTASNSTISKQSAAMGTKLSGLLDAGTPANSVTKTFANALKFEETVNNLKTWAQGKNIQGKSSTPNASKKTLSYKLGKAVITAISDGRNMMIQATPDAMDILKTLDPSGVGDYK